jgi:hypothetical protein
VTFDPTTLAKCCEFCGSAFAAPLPEEQVSAQRDSTIVPFRVDKAAALERFRAWLEKGLFKPSDLLQNLQTRGYEGLYIPFWAFQVDVQTAWQGQYSQTHYRRVSKQRTNADGRVEHYEEDEPYKVWYPRDGIHNGHYLDHIVSSGALSQSEVDPIMPYDLTESRSWTDDYIAGFKAELPGKPRDVAWRECLARIEEWEHDACAHLVERLDSASSEVLSREDGLAYLPVWSFAYTYKGRNYRALVNGQSGETRGTKPVSTGKVVLAIVIAAVVIAAIVGLVLMLNR